MSSKDTKMPPEYDFPFLCGAVDAFIQMQKDFDRAIDGLIDLITDGVKELFEL